MSTFWRIIKDAWQVAMLTWIILVIMEIIQPGMVQRFINLEYYFYTLFLVMLIFISTGQIRFHNR